MKKGLIPTLFLTLISILSFGQYNTNLGTDAGNSGSNNTSVGYKAGDNVTGANNSFFGYYAGSNVISQGNNTFLGTYAGNRSTSTNSTFIGAYSGARSLGSHNTFVGDVCGRSNGSGGLGDNLPDPNNTGSYNSFLGWNAGNELTSGNNNVLLGGNSGFNIITGSNNIFLGYSSGYNNSGNSNVFVGYQSGYNETGSNKLYIENSSSSIPLIYGDFSTNQVGVNTLPGNFTLNVGGPINATGLYVNGQVVSFGDIPPGVSPWTIDGTAINYNNGNVGLGVLSNAPAYKLDVNGSINATGFLLNGVPQGQWTASGSTIYYSGGNVGIGTTNTGSFKLAVEGKIAAREVEVTTANPWPDYVFDAEHKLLTLLEVEQFIKANRHLPEIPSEAEIKANGHKLGEMDVLLLKKIEELTLYIIDLKKEVEEIKKEVLKSNPKK